MKDYPTSWQRKTMWAALTAFFVVLLIVIVGAVIWTGANIISFLQPILIRGRKKVGERAVPSKAHHSC